MSKKKRGDKVIPKNVKKAFAIATYIATALHAFEEAHTLEEELIKLQLQVARAMKVFGAIGGTEMYLYLSDKNGDMWETLSQKNGFMLKEESLPLLVEYLCMLIPPKDFKEFIGVLPYSRERHLYMTEYPMVVKSVIMLNEELNSFYGTKFYTLPLPKKEVTKKVKEKRVKKQKASPQKPQPKKKYKKYLKKKEGHTVALSKLKAMVQQAKSQSGND